MKSSLDLSLSRSHFSTLLEFARVSHTLRHLNPTKLAQFPPLDIFQGPAQPLQHLMARRNKASSPPESHLDATINMPLCNCTMTSTGVSPPALRISATDGSYRGQHATHAPWHHPNHAFLSGDASVHAPLSARTVFVRVCVFVP